MMDGGAGKVWRGSQSFPACLPGEGSSLLQLVAYGWGEPDRREGREAAKRKGPSRDRPQRERGRDRLAPPDRRALSG